MFDVSFREINYLAERGIFEKLYTRLNDRLSFESSANIRYLAMKLINWNCIPKEL
jgi:hypothetical protein